MAEWENKTLRLKDGHGSQPRPGYKALVADRGAVRFEYPEDWVVVPDETGTLKLHDRQPPDDDCTLQMTVFYLNPEIDWSRLPLPPLVEKLLEDDSRFLLDRAEVVSYRQGRVDVSWSEVRFMDPQEARPAYSRICLARFRDIQPLITFDFWENDAIRCRAAWETVLATLRLGEAISNSDLDSDSTVGPSKRERRRDRGRGEGPSTRIP